MGGSGVGVRAALDTHPLTCTGTHPQPIVWTRRLRFVPPIFPEMVTMCSITSTNANDARLLVRVLIAAVAHSRAIMAPHHRHAMAWLAILLCACTAPAPAVGEAAVSAMSPVAGMGIWPHDCGLTKPRGCSCCFAGRIIAKHHFSGFVLLVLPCAAVALRERTRIAVSHGVSKRLCSPRPY